MLEFFRLGDAINAIAKSLPKPEVEPLPLEQALGRRLAGDLTSLVDHPSCDDSALDGFAVQAENISPTTPSNSPLRIVGTSKPGAPWPGRLERGEAVRIATGAVVPLGANSILRIEHARIEGDRLWAMHPAEAAIRHRGENLRMNTTYIHHGTRLEGRHIALAALMGHANVNVFKRLRVALIITGNELQSPGTGLSQGEVYDANGPGLTALLLEQGNEIVHHERIPDDRTLLRLALKRARAANAQLIVTSGGASVGEQDLMRQLLLKSKKVIFSGLRIKPGGPTLCGYWQELPVLALPGNPVSNFVIAHTLLRSALTRSVGIPETTQPPTQAQAITRFHGTKDKLTLARATLAWKGNTLTAAEYNTQSSGALRALVECNGLALIPENTTPEPGDLLKVLWL